VPGASAQVEIEVIPAASFSHQASLSAALPDPNPLNNSLQATFNLGPAQPGLFLPLVTRSASLPPAPTEPHPAITLSAHSAGLTPADPLTLDWQATDAAGLGLELSVRVPGEVLSATGSLPGAVPANGERYYLTPQHTWQITPTLFLTPTASGSLQVMLPGSQEGEFAFSARLTGPGGYLPAGDSLSVLSSWSPAVFLHASPPAGANGELQVELLTAAGGAQPEPGLAPQAYVPPPVVVYASLTLNDGSQVALPTFAPALEALYRGPAQNARYDLFKGSLAFFGEGDYTFQASLLDDQPFGNPIYKGLAQFNIKRCDQPASLSGVFTSSSGDPLGGTIDYASVRLVDAVSGASVSAVTPEADGAYGLQARPGWYWLLGQAALGGAWHQASSPAPLLLECAGAQQADLVAAAPIPGAQAAEELTDRPAPAQATDFELSPNASDGLPRVNLYMVTTDAAGLGPVAGSLTDVFAESLFDAQLQNLHLITTDDLQQFIAFEQQRQLTGAQFNNNLANEALEAMGGAEFQITLKFVRLGSSGYQVQASLAKMNGEVVRRVASDFNSQSLTLAMVRQAAARLNRHDNDTKGIPDLFRRLRFEQERPIFPKLSVSVTPAVTLPGANVQASLALKDGNGELMPNKSVSLLHWPAGRALGEPPTVISGTTDAQGSFSAMLPVTTTLGVGHVDARFSRGERSWCVLGLQCQGAAVYTVQLPSSLSLTAGRQVLREGESTQVCANLSDQGAPAAGRTLLLAAAGGTLPQGGVTTTGPDGRRCFLFTAGAGVLAQVEASSSNPQATGKIAFQVLSALSQTIGASPTRVPQGGASAVDTQAKLGPAPIPGAPTQFSLAGPGSLSVINTHTNSNGRAATVYTAPSSGGAGTAMVQAVTFVGNLVITSTTQIAYQPPICQAPAGFNCYDVIPINGLGPYQVDDAGTVWGVTSDIQNNPQPASWSNGTTSVLGTILKPAFFNYMDVVDVAAGGYVALAGSPHPRGQDCGGLCTYAMRWAPGSGLTVMRASGSWERPLRINANGDMAGWQNYAYPHPAIWEVFTDTAKMLANVSMNNGFGRIAFSDGGTMSFNGGSNLLYTWSVGSQTPSSYGFSAYGMDLVGMTMVGVANGVAFKSSGGGLTSLGTLGGGASSASAVNANGAIVGWSSLPNGQTTAFLYKNGTMVDLASLVDYNQVNQITPAIDINANGWILLGAALLKPR
jgi:probable HAF family extracellular repeat protein